jgi:hypothetical protein
MREHLFFYQNISYLFIEYATMLYDWSGYVMMHNSPLNRNKTTIAHNTHYASFFTTESALLKLFEPTQKLFRPLPFVEVAVTPAPPMSACGVYV